MICSFLKVELGVLQVVPNTEPRKDLVHIILLLVILEYSVMGLSYLTIYDMRRSMDDQNRLNKGVRYTNTHLFWNMTVCFITLLAALASLALESSGFNRNDCLVVCEIIDTSFWFINFVTR